MRKSSCSQTASGQRAEPVHGFTSSAVVAAAGHRLVCRSLALVLALGSALAFPASAQDVVLEPNVRVDDAPDGTNQIWPQVALDAGGDLHAMWMDDRLGAWHIFHAVSLDGGESWSAARRVDQQGLSGWFPAVAARGAGEVYAFWRGGDYNLYFARSANGGANWTLPVKVNQGNTGSADYWGQSIAVDGDGWIYAAWSDNRNGVYTDVFTSRSTDGGVTWLAPNVRANDDLGLNPVAAQPSLRVGGDGVLYLVHNLWVGGGQRYPDVALVRSFDRGLSWLSPGTRVNDITLYYQQVGDVALALDAGGRVYVTWYHWLIADTPTIRCAISRDAGATFLPSVVVPHDAAASSGVPPAICAADADHAYVTWQYDIHGEHDIFISETRDGGASWSDPSVRVDDAPPGAEYQYSPVPVADASGGVWVVWMDGRLSGGYNYDIWSARGRSASAVEGQWDLLHPAESPHATLRSQLVRDAIEFVVWMPRDGCVDLRLFDVGGRHLGDCSRHLPAGETEWSVSVTQLAGRGLPDGAYVYQLRSPAGTRSGRLIRIGE